MSADVLTRPHHLDHERIRQSPIATFKLGDVESDLIPRGTRYPLVDLDHPSLTGAPYPGMIRAAGQPAKSLACCIPAEGGANARRSHPCSAPPDPAVTSCRSWKESGTATARDWLTPAGAHGQA